MSASEPEFLDVDDVLELHETQLAVYGGGSGLRDRGLLESAVAQPQLSFGGEFVHDGLFAMAAAYLFHIVSNHPFVDGNERAGLLAALLFLDINGISIEHPSDALYELTSASPRDVSTSRPSPRSSRGSRRRAQASDISSTATRTQSRMALSAVCSKCIARSTPIDACKGVWPGAIYP